jgi:23S rRNA pseudouridine1911/1915/1917 synthase
MSSISKHYEVVFDSGEDGLYTTKILDWQKEDDDTCKVKVELFRGFRHQIRSHLAWIGFPILNDSLYGGEKTIGSELALKAVSLSFRDPETLEAVKVSL